jgi:CheY-like chemotaxis protein
LIVDDNIFNILTAETIFETKFHTWPRDSALNGQIAFDLVKEREESRNIHPCTFGHEEPGMYYKLILMDCNMPVMDGFESSKLIRTFIHGCGSRQPFISALIAFTNESLKELSFAPGMNIFHKKPLNSDNLAEVIHSSGI